MEFGKILDQWDKQTGSAYDKDAESSALTGGFLDSRMSAAFRRKRLLHKRPDAAIDLHGLTRDEAWDALTVFFNDAKNKGLEKVLVIHGKGSHGSNRDSSHDCCHRETGALKKMVRDFVERCPFAGESGYSEGRSGGEGSSWVLLKNYRSR